MSLKAPTGSERKGLRTKRKPSGTTRESLGGLGLPNGENETAVLLALSVLHQRLCKLSKEAQADFNEVLPDLWGTDEEARSSALRAINEIIGAKPGRLIPLDLTAAENLSELSPWLEFFSGKLKRARKEANLTQQQLAERSGLGQDHISRLEKGVFSPTDKTRQALAQALGKPPKYFDPSAEDVGEVPPHKMTKPARANAKKNTSSKR